MRLSAPCGISGRAGEGKSCDLLKVAPWLARLVSNGGDTPAQVLGALREALEDAATRDIIGVEEPGAPQGYKSAEQRRMQRTLELYRLKRKRKVLEAALHDEIPGGRRTCQGERAGQGVLGGAGRLGADGRLDTARHRVCGRGGVARPA